MTTIELRERLAATFNDLADQAVKARQWEAASAFQYAAGLAFGAVDVVDKTARPSVQSEPCPKRLPP